MSEDWRQALTLAAAFFLLAVPLFLLVLALYPSTEIEAERQLRRNIAEDYVRRNEPDC